MFFNHLVNGLLYDEWLFVDEVLDRIGSGRGQPLLNLYGPFSDEAADMVGTTICIFSRRRSDGRVLALDVPIAIIGSVKPFQADVAGKISLRGMLGNSMAKNIRFLNRGIVAVITFIF
jgi:hypothetical protein